MSGQGTCTRGVILAEWWWVCAGSVGLLRGERHATRTEFVTVVLLHDGNGSDDDETSGQSANDEHDQYTRRRLFASFSATTSHASYSTPSILQLSYYLQ